MKTGRKAKGSHTKSKNEKPIHSKSTVYIAEMIAHLLCSIVEVKTQGWQMTD